MYSNHDKVMDKGFIGPVPWILQIKPKYNTYDL